MFLIVGLGNPEEKYAKTFHNLGFLAAADCAELLHAKFKKKECEASVAETNYKGEKLVIARPTTYMNASRRGSPILPASASASVRRRARSRSSITSSRTSARRITTSSPRRRTAPQRPRSPSRRGRISTSS